MKKLWLIAFFFNLSLLSYTKESFSFVSGEKFSSDYFKFQSYQTNDAWNFGAFVSSAALFPNFALSLSLGNLTAGGTISRLNNPAFSSSLSPYSLPSCKATLPVISFAGSSSFTKPVSYFMEAKVFNSKKTTLFKTNIFYDPENVTGTAGLLFDYSPSKKTNLAVSFTTGLFKYQGYKSDSWFMENKYFSQGIMSASNIQASIKIKDYNSLFTLNLYNSPYGNLDFNLKTENTIKINHLVLNLNLFYSPEKSITSAAKFINPQLQIKTGVQYSLLKGIKKRGGPKPLLIKTGFNAYAKFEETGTYKISTGLTFTSEKNNLTLSSNFSFQDNPLPDQFPLKLVNLSLSLKDSFYIEKILIKLGTSFSYDFLSKESLEKISLSAFYDFNNLIYKGKTKNKDINFSLDSGVSFEFTQKDFNYKKDEKDLYLTLKFRWKWINLYTKVCYLF